VKTRNKPPEFCETLRQAEARWQIPRSELSRAKAAGCLGFRGGRLYKTEIVEWLAANPRPAGEGQVENIRVEKVRKQVEKLSLEIDTQRGKLISREVVREFCGGLVGDVFEIVGRHVPDRESFNAISRELKAKIGKRGEVGRETL
jgi:hypothetical protein